MIASIKKALGLDHIQLTDEFKATYDALENTYKNYFLTGKAGTGKSTLIDYFRKHSKKRIAVLAPTGIAALNVRGQTIHSFFSFPPRLITPDALKRAPRNAKLYSQLDTIIIDEASMVRADLLDGIDFILRKYGPEKSLPFGGIQIILVGDLYQLPPVVTNQERYIIQSIYPSPYFFSAHSFASGNFSVLELSQVFRQSETEFVDLLNLIRSGQAGEDDLRILNDQAQKSSRWFNPPPVTLAAVNQVADTINAQHLLDLPDAPSKYTAKITGQLPGNVSNLPAEIELNLKPGARVMFIKNGPDWVNGTLGTIEDLGSGTIYVRTDDGQSVEVIREVWEQINYQLDEETGQVKEQLLGQLSQFPLRLAWAITIHKSQGQTFNRVHLDYTRRPFAPGQTYVALSRARALAGISLTRPLTPKDIIVDPRIINFTLQSHD